MSRPRPRASAVAAGPRRVAAPRPRPQRAGLPVHHVSALPFAARRGGGCALSPRGSPSRHRQIFCFPRPLAAVILNRQEPEAYIYRETRVPEAAWAPFGCLLKNFYNLEGSPHLNFFFFFGNLEPLTRTAENHKLPGRAILFLRTFCLRSCSRERAVPELLGPLLCPRASSSFSQLHSATCEPRRGPRLQEEPLLSCVVLIRSPPGGARGGGGWGNERCSQQLPHGLPVRG